MTTRCEHRTLFHLSSKPINHTNANAMQYYYVAREGKCMAALDLSPVLCTSKRKDGGSLIVEFYQTGCSMVFDQRCCFLFTIRSNDYCYLLFRFLIEHSH